MKISQTYAELNNIVEAMTGKKRVGTDDINPQLFVSIGNDILSSTNGVQNFGRALGDRIAKIISELPSYMARARYIWADNITYGSALKIMHIKDYTNSSDTMYGNTPHVDPSQQGAMADFTISTYSKTGVWSYSDLIVSRDQIEKAFISPVEMGAFLETMFTAVYNNREIDKEATDNEAIVAAIADCNFNRTTKPMRWINLIAQYVNEGGTAPASPAAAMRDKDFLRFASMFIARIRKQMATKSVLFNNATGISMASTPDDNVVEVLTNFADASKFYLESDAYHNTLVQLPNYTEVAYWQGMGDASFGDVSKVYFNNELWEPDDPDVSEISYIVAQIRDKKAVRSMYDKVYTDTYYNPATRNTTYFFRSEKGYLIDTAYPIVTFYLAV